MLQISLSITAYLVNVTRIILRADQGILPLAIANLRLVNFARRPILVNFLLVTIGLSLSLAAVRLIAVALRPNKIIERPARCNALFKSLPEDINNDDDVDRSYGYIGKSHDYTDRSHSYITRSDNDFS